MPLLLLVLSILALFLVVACQDETGPSAGLSFEYYFGDSDHGFKGDFTDLPVDFEPDIYDLKFAHTNRPASLTSEREGKALMLSAINRSDDIFMYVSLLSLPPMHLLANGLR